MQFSQGFSEGLELAISLLEQEQENNPPVADSHFAEVPTCEKGHVGRETWVKLERYRETKSQRDEAIAFIDRMVKMWNAGAEIGGELLAEYKSTEDGGSRAIPLHVMAKGIIERAKGARDDDGI